MSFGETHMIYIFPYALFLEYIWCQCLYVVPPFKVMWHPCFKWGHASPFRLRVMWCCRRHHASPVPYPSTRREGTGSMGVLCLGGNRVWETHLYGHIGYFTWVVDLTSGASPLFWYILLWRLLFIFVINLTSEASSSSCDFLYERFWLTFACNEFLAYWKLVKVFTFWLSFGL